MSLGSQQALVARCKHHQRTRQVHCFRCEIDRVADYVLGVVRQVGPRSALFSFPRVIPSIRLIRMSYNRASNDHWNYHSQSSSQSTYSQPYTNRHYNDSNWTDGDYYYYNRSYQYDRSHTQVESRAEFYRSQAPPAPVQVRKNTFTDCRLTSGGP